ncbi:MAG: ShlB/FhaC/HecB family hemolysin secretion/activation protein [Chlamydiales bacterium]
MTCLSLIAEESVPAPALKGVILVPKEEKTSGETIGVVTHNLSIPGGAKPLEAKLAKLSLGKPITPELLAEIKQTIILYFREQGRPVVSVTIPEQDITDGVIQVIIVEARVGKISCKGNRWFNNELLQSYLDINPGHVISNDTLLTNVTWMNRNPFRKTDLLLKPGEEEGTTDIELVTKDRFPLRVYAGGDNTGNDATGNNRWFAGFNWGNAFGCDHLLNYQYTTSSDFHDFQAHTINYEAPLSWHHVIILFGGYSSVHPDLKTEHETMGRFRSNGHSAQASLRYDMPIGKLYSSMLKEFLVGFDFKNSNNNLEFVSDDTIPIITKTVNVTQLVAGFNYGKETNHHKFSVALEAFGSPGKMLPHQGNSDFENLRPGAKNRYVYGRMTLGDVYRFPTNFSLSLLLRGQYSSQNLLPSEQFGIGGYNTVRGYNERELNVDNAFVFNFEVRSFAFHLLRKLHDELYFIGFVDYGVGRNHKPLPEDKKAQYLLGAGPGVRYMINPNLSLRVDWGFKLHNTNLDDPGLSKVHFGFILSY